MINKMEIYFFTIGIILITTSFTTAYNIPRAGPTCNSLRYEKVVGDKPDLITINVKMYGLCRIRSNETKAGIDYNVEKDILIGGLGYDAQDQVIYHSGMGVVIYKTRLNDNQQEEVFKLDWKTQERVGIIIDIAYDWITRNLYILFQRAVGVVDSKKPVNLKILRANESLYRNIAVHPNRGFLFLLNHVNYLANVISRTNLDGSNRVSVVNFTEINEESHQSARIESMALDIREDRLYWTVTPATNIIRHSALDGTDVRTIEGPVVYNAGAMALDNRHVYYNPVMYSSFLKRFDKKTGLEDGMFSIDNAMDTSVAMLILDGDSQKVREDHPCKNDNGGCKEFCFASPDNEAKLNKLCAPSSQ